MVNATLQDVSNFFLELCHRTYDESFLDAHTSHVHLQSDLLDFCIVAGIEQRPAATLNQKGRDVSPNEVFCDTRCFETSAMTLWVEVMDQATESHVDKSIGP